MCAGFLGLKVMCVMGESRSSQARCSPQLCMARLQFVYCFSGMLNSNSCAGQQGHGAAQEMSALGRTPTPAAPAKPKCPEAREKGTGKGAGPRELEQESSYLLVRVGNDEVVGAGVDGEGRYGAVVGGHHAVMLQEGTVH